MNYKVLIQDTAKLDIKETKDYYKKINIGLAQRFISELKKLVFKIQSNPESYALRYKNTRMVVLNTFPFVIHFELDNSNKTISILALFYGGENPKNWI